MRRLLFLCVLLTNAVMGFAAPPATSPSNSKRATKLAAPGLQSVQLSAELASFLSDHLAQQLTSHGLQVITAREIQTLLGFERQKQLLSCSDESTSCMAELANALGVDGLVTGSIGKIGTSYQANLKVLSAQDASMLASYSGRVKSEEALLDELTKAARVMAVQIQSGKGPSALVATDASGADVGQGIGVAAEEVDGQASRPSRLVPYLALGGGGLFLVGSGLSYLGARGDAKKLDDAATGKSALTQAEAKKLLDSGKKKERFAAIGGAVGVLAAATGVVLLMTEKPVTEAAPTVSYLPGGGMSVGLAGAWK